VDITTEAAGFMLQREPDWLLLEQENLILPPSALAEALQQQSEEPRSERINLLEIPAEREPVARISLKANLQDALDLMQQHDLQWLAVYRDDDLTRCAGLVSRTHIDHFYQYQPRGR
jgi:CBS domain-containing protein